MKRATRSCTHYATIAGGSNSEDADLVAQIVSAMGRNVAVVMGHWMAHPSGVLVRGTDEERNGSAFFSPTQLLEKMRQAPQPEGSGSYQDFTAMAVALVRAWRWEIETMQKPTTVSDDAAALVQKFGALVAVVVARDWSFYAPAHVEREHWHRVFATIRNAQEPKRVARKPTDKQVAEAQQHAAKMVKAWGRTDALAHAQDWSLRADKRSERGHYERVAAFIQQMPTQA